MKIRTIRGKRGSGKDTLANFMRDELEKMGKRVLIIHFADPVKWFAKELFGWNGIKDEAGRHLLQTLGTDEVRAHDPNFWVDIISRFAVVMDACNKYDYCLIPDARFENELQGVKFRNPEARTVRIERFNEDGSMWYNPALTSEQHNHPSETSLDNEQELFDYYIRNDKDLTNLNNLAMDMIRRMEEL